MSDESKRDLVNNIYSRWEKIASSFDVDELAKREAQIVGMIDSLNRELVKVRSSMDRVSGGLDVGKTLMNEAAKVIMEERTLTTQEPKVE